MNKTNNDWWNVRKGNGQDGFVPANYVKEIEPKVVMVQVRKPEVIKDVKKVKKTKMIKEIMEKRIKKDPSQKSRKEDPRKIEQQVLQSYQEIVGLAKNRLDMLAISIKLFSFFAECEDFERWLLDKQRQLLESLEDEQTTSIDIVKKKFDKLFTDLSASVKRLEIMDKQSLELAPYSKDVKTKQRNVHKIYDELNKLKMEKEKSLEGAGIVELYYQNVKELEEWILEKQEQIVGDVFGYSDLKTVQALQRRHGNLERELEPIRDKLDKVGLLGNLMIIIS